MHSGSSPHGRIQAGSDAPQAQRCNGAERVMGALPAVQSLLPRAKTALLRPVTDAARRWHRGERPGGASAAQHLQRQLRHRARRQVRPRRARRARPGVVRAARRPERRRWLGGGRGRPGARDGAPCGCTRASRSGGPPLDKEGRQACGWGQPLVTAAGRQAARVLPQPLAAIQPHCLAPPAHAAPNFTPSLWSVNKVGGWHTALAADAGLHGHAGRVWQAAAQRQPQHGVAHAGGRKVVPHVHGAPRDRAHRRAPLRACPPDLANEPNRYAFPVLLSTAAGATPLSLGIHPRALVAHARRTALLRCASPDAFPRCTIGDVSTRQLIVLRQAACNIQAQPDSFSSTPFQGRRSASASVGRERGPARPRLARLRADAVEVVDAAARRLAGRPRGLPRYKQVSPGLSALALARRPRPRRPRFRGARRRRRPGRGRRVGAARAVCRQPARGRQVGRGWQRGGARRRRPALLVEVRRRARMAVGPGVGRTWRCSAPTSACVSDTRCCGPCHTHPRRRLCSACTRGLIAA
jgi:hypothetical protein